MELIDLYLALFLSFLKIGLFGFGGGYAMLPLIQHEVVELHGWLSISDFTDIVAISQATPGPIAFNSATYVGYGRHKHGLPGLRRPGLRHLHPIGDIPSFILMTIVTASFFRLKNNPWMRASLSVLKPAIIGLIASAALMLMNRHNFVDYKSWIIFAAVFIASFKRWIPSSSSCFRASWVSSSIILLRLSDWKLEFRTLYLRQGLTAISWVSLPPSSQSFLSRSFLSQSPSPWQPFYRNCFF